MQPLVHRNYIWEWFGSATNSVLWYFRLAGCLCLPMLGAQSMNSSTVSKINPSSVSQRVHWVSNLELPKTLPFKDRVHRYTGFSLLYNEPHEQASWVAYQLTRDETVSRFKRSDKFLVDPNIEFGSATNSDYLKSGYDRGHLAPAADMGWSYQAMTESFYYSNMSPQVPAFNRGIWKRLEEQVRDWAVAYDTLYVVTGPVLQVDLPQIGPNGVSVPKYYYKVVLDYSEPGIKAIGFILPNSGSSESLQSFGVTVDSVEQLTGIDFFTRLNDEQETMLEKSICLSCWQWNGSAGVGSHSPANQSSTGSAPAQQTPNNPAGAVPSKQIQAVQCSGITQAGVRCKRKTTNPNGRCYQH